VPSVPGRMTSRPPIHRSTIFPVPGLFRRFLRACPSRNHRHPLKRGTIGHPQGMPLPIRIARDPRDQKQFQSRTGLCDYNRLSHSPCFLQSSEGGVTLMRIQRGKIEGIFFVREVLHGSGKKFPRFSECSFSPRRNEHSEK
jgi:hypothetical protein